MKNKINWILLYIIVFLSFTACKDNKTEIMTNDLKKVSLKSEEDTKKNNSINSIEGNIENKNLWSISINKMLEDYEEMWTVLEDNYMFFDLAAKENDLNIDEIYNQYKELLTEEDELSMLEFYNYLDDCLSKFNGLGHLRMISLSHYKEASKLVYNGEFSYRSSRGEPDPYLMDIYNNEKTKKAYKAINMGANDDYLNNTSNLEVFYESPSMRVIDEDIGYIKMPTMRDTRDYEKQLIEFYEKVDKFPYLIIDITGNGGGNDYNWKK